MLYDYKNEKQVQQVILDCFCPLLEDLEDEFFRLKRYEGLYLFAPSRVALEVVSRLLEEFDETFVHPESSTLMLYGDNNEILVSLGWDGCIFIEEARGNNGWLKRGNENELIYVYDGFSKKDVDKLAESQEYILVFGFEDEDELFEDDELDECADCDVCEMNDECPGDELRCCDNEMADDEDSHGFTVSRHDDNGYESFSFYSSEKLDTEDIVRILDIMGFKIDK